MQERFEPIFEALNATGVRYVVVGGVAVILHGHIRFTKDLDLVIELVPNEARKALEALSGLGYQPKIPVAATDFADPKLRERWITEKNMIVFQLYHDKSKLTIDVFVKYPIDFEELWTGAKRESLMHTDIRIASIDHLIRMKKEAGRPQDLIDAQWLATIQQMQKEQTGEKN